MYHDRCYRASLEHKLYCFLTFLTSYMDRPVKSFISQLSVNFWRLLEFSPADGLLSKLEWSSCRIMELGGRLLIKCCLAQSSLICLFIIRALRICVAVNLTPIPPKAANGGGGSICELEVSSSWRICREQGWLDKGYWICNPIFDFELTFGWFFKIFVSIPLSGGLLLSRKLESWSLNLISTWLCSRRNLSKDAVSIFHARSHPSATKWARLFQSDQDRLHFLLYSYCCFFSSALKKKLQVCGRGLHRLRQRVEGRRWLRFHPLLWYCYRLGCLAVFQSNFFCETLLFSTLVSGKLIIQYN